MKIMLNVVLLAALSSAALSGCAGLMPAGAGFGAGRVGGHESSKQPVSVEHLVYRIDGHRYITINGNDNCEGSVVYYDRQLGIRKPVAYSGFSLGYGVAEGRYAIDSTYIAIPVLGWSDSMGGVCRFTIPTIRGGRSINFIGVLVSPVKKRRSRWGAIIFISIMVRPGRRGNLISAITFRPMSSGR